MNRLKAILAHLHQSDTITPDAIRKAQVLQDVEEALSLPTPRLRRLQLEFLTEMLHGLRDTESSTIKMLTSYVFKRATSDVNGFYYALDLGGTNFRVWRVTVKQGKVVKTDNKAFTIPRERMAGEAEELFDYIARCCKSFVDQDAKDDLGFTFSFPVDQRSIDSGFLIAWTKGFTTNGVEGKDVVHLLKQAFERAALKLNIAALCNDTVGTLVTEYFKDPASQIGVILGTGSNACYWEKVGNIGKYVKSNPRADPNDVMCINMEWGNFDSISKSVLPLTNFDFLVDYNSPNPGAQLFEKMISGMYLGEVCRYIYIHFISRKILPTLNGIEMSQSFQAQHLSAFLEDTTPTLSGIEGWVRKTFHAHTNIFHRQILREVCVLVSRRAARLSAAGIATVVAKIGSARQCTVSIDGSVFEKIPGFKKAMEDCLDELFADEPHAIKLVLTSGGSGVGAGLIAALATHA